MINGVYQGLYCHNITEGEMQMSTVKYSLKPAL